MKNSISINKNSLVVGLMTMIMLVAAGGRIAAEACASAPVEQQIGSALSKCRTDLANRLKLQEEEITLADAQTVVWPDASLGMPEIGKVYAQVQTPGERLILQARDVLYLYTASAKTIRYGGPLRTWAYSMLYLQPIKDEPNLNGNLYQCSLLGTNSIRLASGVTDYYPQYKGTVIIKRRTSRSGHDLLFIKADEPGKEKMLYQAIDFGDAAMNRDQDRWAGYVRPRLGSNWVVVVGSIGQEKPEALTLPLPEGIRPGKIAWSGDMLMILAKKDERLVAFETTPKADAEWKPLGVHTFPGQDAFMLNKSETLEINQVEVDGKPGVEVARVWFTGDRNVVAKIPDLNLKGYELLGSYAFIWGERASISAAYTVDIRTGDSIVSLPGDGRNIKPFIYPPHDSPVPSAPKMVD